MLLKRALILIAAFYSMALLAQVERSDSVIVRQMRAEGVTFSHDNSVVLLTSGQKKFDDMFAAIRQAKSSVHL